MAMAVAMAALPRAEGVGLVPVASSMRNMDARYYSAAQCVGQLAENSAAKGSQFNATTFEVSILSHFDSFKRAKGTDIETHIDTQALKALDDGVGFRYEEVEDMLTYGTPESLSATKKFGQNNHGLKAVAATLSPACCLLFSKSKRPDGTIWHTLLAFGSNFDAEGLYSFRKLSWPATFDGTSLLQLADEDFFQCGSKEAFQDMFRIEGKPWASLKDLAAAHSYFKEIKSTGVLGIFPFGQQANTLQVKVEDADIKLQGVSLKELLEKYFVARELELLPADYWTGYRGFSMVLIVNRRKKIIITPRAPQFEVSPRLPVKIGPAEHTVVYGPYRSDRNELSLFPYASKAGNSFYNKGYDFFLASNSRVMNPLYQPKTSDNRDVQKDYYSKQRSQNQKSGGSLQSMLLEEMCGVKLSDVPEHFEQLKDLLNDLRVFDSKNPYLKQSEEYQKQMKNLKWLLGLPFEITVRIDTEYLHFNDAKDDLKDDALKRDAFFASVHAVIALDVCQRMKKGFVRLTHDLDEQPRDNQAKINTLFKPGKDSGASRSTPAKRTAAKRGSKKAERAQPAEQAQQSERAQPAEHAQQSEEPEEDDQQAGSGRVPDRDPTAPDREAALTDVKPAFAAAEAEAAAGPIPHDNGSLGDQGTLSARAARHLLRLNQPSPSEPRVGKRRRASTPADGPDLPESAAEDGGLNKPAKVSRRVTFSRGLLEVAEPAGKQKKQLDVCIFKELWQQAIDAEQITDCPGTREIRDLALEQFQQ